MKFIRSIQHTTAQNDTCLTTNQSQINDNTTVRTKNQKTIVMATKFLKNDYVVDRKKC